MNSFTPDSAIFNSAEQFNIQSNSNFSDPEFYSEKYHLAIVADLYSKHEDEPDFDCEFLYSL